MVANPKQELHALIEQLSDDAAAETLAFARQLRDGTRSAAVRSPTAAPRRPQSLPTLHHAPARSSTRRSGAGVRNRRVSEENRPASPALRCLVDTDVLSYIVRGDTRAESYRAFLAGKGIGVSFQTVAELRRWGRTHRWGSARWQQLQHLLDRITVYLVDDALIDAWAYITAMRDRQGRPIATGDAWIAATAWLQGLPLVTHNRRHFADIEGLDIVSGQT